MEIDQILVQTLIEKIEQMETSVKAQSEKKSEAVNPEFIKQFIDTYSSSLKVIDSKLNSLQLDRPVSSSIREQLKEEFRVFQNKLDERDKRNNLLNEQSNSYYSKQKLIIWSLSIFLISSVYWIIDLNIGIAHQKANDLKYQFLQTQPSPQIQYITSRTDSLFESMGQDKFLKTLKERKNQKRKSKKSKHLN